MKFIKNSVQLPIPNFDNIVEKNKKKNRHGKLLPSTIRAIFCGPSNCGKTNCLLALILDINGVRFENIYVYSKSLKQPKYQYLKDVIEPMEEIKYFPFSEHEEVISPSNTSPNSLMIFDDIAGEKQNNVRDFYSMGRHEAVDSFYLCQTYSKVPKQLVRDNINLVVVFRQDDTNLKHVYNDNVNTDMSFTQFKDFCSACWGDDDKGFLVIDKDRPIKDGRYRKGFDINIVE